MTNKRYYYRQSRSGDINSKPYTSRIVCVQTEKAEKKFKKFRSYAANAYLQVV